MILFLLSRMSFTNSFSLFILDHSRLNNEENFMTHRHVLSVNFSEISTSNKRGENEAANYYNWVNFVYFYSIILCTLLFFTTHRSLLFFKLCIRASVNIHDRLFYAITRAKLRFFECCSSRLILDRFTADVETMDTQVPITLFECLMVRTCDIILSWKLFQKKNLQFQFILEAIAITLLIASVNYWLLFPTLIMLAAAYMLRCFYVNTSRSLRRVESLSKFNALTYLTES